MVLFSDNLSNIIKQEITLKLLSTQFPNWNTVNGKPKFPNLDHPYPELKFIQTTRE
jgi:hypothetical protein